MGGPTLSSVSFLVLLLSIISVEIAVGHNVKSDFKDFLQKESAQLSWNLSSLNISSLRILEALKQYEDTTFNSTFKALRESKGSCSDAVGRAFFQIFEGKLWALKRK